MIVHAHSNHEARERPYSSYPAARRGGTSSPDRHVEERACRPPGAGSDSDSITPDPPPAAPTTLLRAAPPRHIREEAPTLQTPHKCVS